MKKLRNYLLAFTLVVAAFAFAGCGNGVDNTTTGMETTSENHTTMNGGNSGIINDTTSRHDNNGVVDRIEDDIESGVNSLETGVNDVVNGTRKK